MAKTLNTILSSTSHPLAQTRVPPRVLINRHMGNVLIVTTFIVVSYVSSLVGKYMTQMKRYENIKKLEVVNEQHLTT